MKIKCLVALLLACTLFAMSVEILAYRWSSAGGNVGLIIHGGGMHGDCIWIAKRVHSLPDAGNPKSSCESSKS